MLEQRYFSDLVKGYLETTSNQFLPTINFSPDGSFHCSALSPTGQFSIWIATYNCEITVGLESNDGNSDCHTHFTPYDLDDVKQVFQNLTDILDDISNGQLLFYHSNLKGFSWTSNIVETMMKKKSDEAIEFFSWSGQIDTILF